MAHQAIFAGLVFDEFDQPVDVVIIGDEPMYVVDDAGFRRHIPSQRVDLQVLEAIRQMIEGHEEILSAEAAKMLGQDDIFSKALIESQLKQIDQQYESLLETGIPEEGRAYIGMMGFRIKIDVHGEVIEIVQPGMTDLEDE